MWFPICDIVKLSSEKSFTLTYDDGEKRVTVKCSGCDIFEAAEHLAGAIERAERNKE